MARRTISSADLLVPFEAEGFERLLRTDEGDAAAGDDAFFDGRAGRVQGVFDAGLLFLHLGLGRGADVDDGHAAGELGQAFLELLAVVVAGGLLDLAADLGHAALDVRVLAAAFDDGGVFLVDRRCAWPRPRSSSETFSSLMPRSSVMHAAAGEDGDVFEHGLAAVAEAGSLDGATWSVPRSLLTTSVASASPSTSSAMISSGLPALATFSSSGSRSFRLLIFFSWIRM